MLRALGNLIDQLITNRYTSIKVQISELTPGQARRRKLPPEAYYSWKVTSYGTLVGEGYTSTLPLAVIEAKQSLLGI